MLHHTFARKRTFFFPGIFRRADVLITQRILLTSISIQLVCQGPFLPLSHPPLCICVFHSSNRASVYFFLRSDNEKLPFCVSLHLFYFTCLRINLIPNWVLRSTPLILWCVPTQNDNQVPTESKVTVRNYNS